VFEKPPQYVKGLRVERHADSELKHCTLLHPQQERDLNRGGPLGLPPPGISFGAGH
jgi:hypothetical protein